LATGGREFEAIVLAAGAGRRFGGRKLLAPYAGAPLVESALRTAFAAPVSRVTVVTGFDAADVEAVVRASSQVDSRLNLVFAERHAEGMGASLACAAAEVADEAAGVFVFLGDMPRVPLAVLQPLTAALALGLAAAPAFAGRRGHPVLFGSPLLPRLRALEGDEGARAVVAGLGEDLQLVPSPDDGVLFDIDERQQLPR
jgi:molybdenum cofactor cytidylyltransferase